MLRRSFRSWSRGCQCILTVEYETREEVRAMNLPSLTAEASLYRTSSHYCTLGSFGHLNGVVQPTYDGTSRCMDDCLREGNPDQYCMQYCRTKPCVDRCVDTCVKAGIRDNPDVPLELLREECTPPCEIRCEARPGGFRCPPGTELCSPCPCPSGTAACGPGLCCCAPGQQCCTLPCCDPATTRCVDGVCCPVGQVCRICQPSLYGIGEVCWDRCCKVSESCSEEGCCPVNQAIWVDP